MTNKTMTQKEIDDRREAMGEFVADRDRQRHRVSVSTIACRKCGEQFTVTENGCLSCGYDAS